MGLLLTWVACAPEEPPAGPPRCEPSTELEVERGLKQGYKALVDRDTPAAREAFTKVLKRSPGHPDARNGLRQVEHLKRNSGQLSARMVAMISGRPVAIAASINSERMRYEEEMARRPMRGRINGGRADKLPVPYAVRRKADKGQVNPEDGVAVRALIDLVVLHDSYTVDARTFFVESSEEGKSTHFIIDYDGTIYQVLDLGRAARHTGLASVDRRSVDVTIVNPVDRDRPALPSGVLNLKRPLSAKTRRRGKEWVQWGYTEAQMRSLRQLVNGLVRVLPRVPPKIARGPQGAALETTLPNHGAGFRGVVGHAQISEKANDPSVALDWDSLKLP